MELKLLLIGFVVVASGCVGLGVETVEVSGMNSEQVISSEDPVRVVVSGMGSEVTVSEGTEVTELVISGRDVTVYLPEESDARIDNSGANSKVVRR